MKKIVFDLGNVLMTFSPDDFLKDLFKSELTRQKCKEVYFQGLWNEYDRGYLSPSEMIEKGCNQYPECKEDFTLMMQNWFRYVQPIESSVKLVESLRKKGYDLYILSNIPKDCYEYLCQNVTGFKDLKGVYSYQEKYIKPEKEIYEIFLNRYHLQAKDCLFIDDRVDNIQQAKQMGFQTIHCTDYAKLPVWLERKINEKN